MSILNYIFHPVSMAVAPGSGFIDDRPKPGDVTMTLIGPDGPVPGTTARKPITAAASAQFPLGDFTATVGWTQIVFEHWVQPNRFQEGGFNGPTATRIGGWSGHSIDASSTMEGFTEDRISIGGINDDTIRFDMQGLGFDTSTRLVINITPQ